MDVSDCQGCRVSSSDVRDLVAVSKGTGETESELSEGEARVMRETSGRSRDFGPRLAPGMVY